MTTDAADSASHEHSRSADTLPATGSARTVLLADDQADERAIQRALLEHLGYRVLEADDGEQAVRIAREALPDLILLDIAMPRMDGLAVCRSLRADPRTAAIEILFFTASAVGDVDEQVKTAGGNGVLIKPIDPQDVADAVRERIGIPHE